MGWLFGYRSKGELIKELLKVNSKFTVERHCVRGNCLWSVIHFKDEGIDEKYINLDLLEKYDGRWGYKRMDETAGPYYVSCPLSYIEMVDMYPPKGYAEQWRKNVRDYHKHR